MEIWISVTQWMTEWTWQIKREYEDNVSRNRYIMDERNNAHCEDSPGTRRANVTSAYTVPCDFLNLHSLRRRRFWCSSLRIVDAGFCWSILKWYANVHFSTPIGRDKIPMALLWTKQSTLSEKVHLLKKCPGAYEMHACLLAFLHLNWVSMFRFCIFVCTHVAIPWKSV